MIHLSCKDKIIPKDARDIINLSDELDYVARSFGLTAEQVHATPPDGLPIILVQPLRGEHVQGEDSLVDFVHPDDCVYFFGGSKGHLKLDRIVPVAKIYIPHSPTWNMFASQAAAIVLYDRFVKRGSFG